MAHRSGEMTDKIKLIELQCPNIRELTKKERILGLNVKSWFICTAPPTISHGYIGILNALILFAVMIIIFYIAEYFDEDIAEILFAKGSADKTKTYWA